MKRRVDIGKRFGMWLLVLVCVPGVGVSGGRAYAGHGGAEKYERAYDHDYAGTLVVDGYFFEIERGRLLGAQMAHALQVLGYKARASGMGVRIDFDYGVPRVRWLAGKYLARFIDLHDGLRILLRRNMHYGKARILPYRPRCGRGVWEAYRSGHDGVWVDRSCGVVGRYRRR